MAIFLIDYDGTVVPRLPENGYSDHETGAEQVLKRIIASGHQLVLWTARNRSRNNPYNYIGGKYRNELSLDEAERWFKERNIPLYGINDVPGEEDIIGSSRKAYGDFLIDDTAVGTPLKWCEVSYISYDTGEILTINTYHVDWDSIEMMLVQGGIIM